MIATERPGKSKPASAQSSESATTHEGGETRSHIVRRGESAWTIARKYGLRPAELLSSNGLSSTTVLQPGMVLKLQTEASPK